MNENNKDFVSFLFFGLCRRSSKHRTSIQPDERALLRITTASSVIIMNSGRSMKLRARTLVLYMKFLQNKKTLVFKRNAEGIDKSESLEVLRFIINRDFCLISSPRGPRRRSNQHDKRISPTVWCCL